MIRKTVRLMISILFSIAILVACAKPVEVVTLPPPTNTQVSPTPTLEPSPTAIFRNPDRATEGILVTSDGTTELVSIASDGTQGNGLSYAPTISADGRYVAFSSNASNLVEGDTNGSSDIFVRDRVTGKTQRVSVASDGTQGD